MRIVKAKANKLYKYSGKNPFTDNQGRNFSDMKVIKEFCPISKFWDFFNHHHEILFGTRGSGKTFLLKMMRRSMLSNVEHELAKQILEEKVYFSFYVPMHMETVAALNDSCIEECRRITLFKFIFNLLLAESIISELIWYLNANYEKKRAFELSSEIACRVFKIWFPDKNDPNLVDLQDLDIYVRQLMYNFDYKNGDLTQIPVALKNDLAGALMEIQPLLEKYLRLMEKPTWIVCVDEAEFLPEIFQKCINSFMRSDTKGIILKVATLPFYWKTLETIDNNISISVENDFSIQYLDMDCDSIDFVHLTNKLCKHRIESIKELSLSVNDLADFVGKEGNDNRIDYYKMIFGEEKASSEQVKNDILASFSAQRKSAVIDYSTAEKTIRQRFAPVLFVREVYKSQHAIGKGRYISGWYAGPDIIRKVSQGNPRLFIRLMCNLFSAATSNQKFDAKIQHKVITKFAEEFCEASKAIEVQGEEVYENLSKTGAYIQEKVHNGAIIPVGNSFKYKYKNGEEFQKWKPWIEKAIAFSKISVSNDAIMAGLSQETIYTLSNAYATKYWIPMRNDDVTQIPTNYSAKKKEVKGQLSLFD